MKPLPFNDITKAVQSMLRKDVRLEAIRAIERSPLLNEDPTGCPWVGIYRNTSVFDVRALGYGRGARYQRSEFVIVIQTANANNGEETEDELEDLVAIVLDAIFSDATIGGVIATINLAKVQYRLLQVQTDDFLQQAELYLTAETTTR